MDGQAAKHTVNDTMDDREISVLLRISSSTALEHCRDPGIQPSVRQAAVTAALARTPLQDCDFSPALWASAAPPVGRRHTVLFIFNIHDFNCTKI